MTNTRIFLEKKLKVGEACVLTPDASQHLLRVLRAKKGDALIVFNGDGGQYKAKLISIEKNKAAVEIISFENVTRESPLKIHLFQGVSRGERMDYVIQKATELGVAEITPVFTQRCNVKLSDDRLSKRIDHWQGIAVAASEQSGRCVVPKINVACLLCDVFSLHHSTALICDTESSKKISEFSLPDSSVSLLIGPEGGFDSQELVAAKAAGFIGLSLGPRILRTETAPVTAIALLQAYHGDL